MSQERCQPRQSKRVKDRFKRVQIALAEGEEWVGALHGLLALVVMVLGAYLAWLAWRELRPRAITS